ncbi:MAG: AbrB family transcriptional regulator [Roseococcus sp.]|nr:AbrB family transcriptional regulator [Roseococcus sp.]
MSRLSRLIPSLLTLAAALAGGALCHALRVPLAWMIGAMLGTAALAWSRPVAVHPAARPAALILLGLAFGQGFSGPVLAALLGAAPAILAAGLLSIAAGVAAVPIFTRLAGTDARTGFFSAIPGGVVVMAVLAQRAGASLASVTLAQTLRVAIVVLLVPAALTAFAPHGDGAAFLAPRPAVAPLGLAAMLALGVLAALALRRTGVANPWMIGPCLLALAGAALGVLPSAVPSALVDAAQVAMGMALGQRLTPEFLLRARRLLLAATLSALFLVALCLVLGLLLAWASGLPPAAVLLGLAPGGMPEMGVTAKALEVAVPLVLAFHLARTLMCNFLLGPLWSVLSRLGWR